MNIKCDICFFGVVIKKTFSLFVQLQSYYFILLRVFVPQTHFLLVYQSGLPIWFFKYMLFFLLNKSFIKLNFNFLFFGESQFQNPHGKPKNISIKTAKQAKTFLKNNPNSCLG